MKTQTDPKVDYAFKHVFGREASKPALMSLLNAVLEPHDRLQIADLDLLNPFNEKSAVSDKLSIVDIKARDESGRQFFVEMQMAASDVFRQRALYYWAALYREQLQEGDDYALLRPTIAVCFLDASLFSGRPDFHLVFELRERLRQELFTDQLAVHILELPKFHKEIHELTTPLDRWLYFLRHGEELDAQEVPMPLDVPEVRWALGDLFMISRTDPDRELYEARLKERRDRTAYWEAGLAQGRAEGRTEGRAEGLAEGKAELRRADIHAEQKRRGLTVTSLEDLQKLSLDELEKIWTRLLADRLDGGDEK